MPEAPPTDEGWYALHDFRTVDWDAWRDAPGRERDRAVGEGVEYLRTHEAVEDAAEGDSAVFSVLGHKADLLVVHFRPTLDDLSRAERQFERTALASYTEQAASYVSVTEVSGYVSREYFEEEEADIDEGLRRYIEGKLTPEIPEDQYVSFYPMSKRRGETHNWYDLAFEKRAEMMSEHGDTGKEYAGKIKQVIASSVGFDDYEWGVTLFAEDPAEIKNIVYEMRFDEASSKYGEFGQFYVGRRFPPADLGAYLEGESVPTAEEGDPHGEGAHAEGEPGHGHGSAHGHAHGDGPHDGGHGGAHGGGGGGGVHGDAPHGESAGEDVSSDTDADAVNDGIRGELEDLNIYAGKPHGEDVYATVLYSEADTDDLFDEVDGLRGNFDHYGTHVKTALYEARDGGRTAVVSIWETQSAAETAAGFLSELPGIVSRAGEESGFGTMGMFYTVKPDYRDDFVEKFDTVGGVLADTEGHQDTDLMVNVEDENDMFIASQWTSREDAMGFFRSDAFRDTVQWGRDVLADRPRHVFLA
ncbi:heme-binding protein [Halogeometricum sp. S1BR25-6]|uniref:Heme-binding protein n=1 Tax=Halogeometricum salsisoli TaxID=2950536 RepID=A0ABU2GGK8_9EURY|nr:heme-binding protein [Halogeometricum sp. S1BR25-6]MDS0299952.1 heme-binding protein [Halogeometricum sp. S1BR25-6]